MPCAYAPCAGGIDTNRPSVEDVTDEPVVGREESPVHVWYAPPPYTTEPRCDEL